MVDDRPHTESAQTKDVVKVVMRGAVTSFRYPHFIQGVQPTYEMPPPSTIYGHLCSATGQYEPPENIEFAVHFTYAAKQRDVEHTHLSVPYIQANPFQRELLFFPRLTLYIAPVYYLEAFRAPHYPVVLGRSQDLMTYESVEVITLNLADQAYFEHTLIPAIDAPYFQRSIGVTMARFIQPESRQPEWGQYAILKDRVLYPPDDALPDVYYPSIWIDTDEDDSTTKEPYKGRHRGLIFQRFVAP
ncbi:MAG: CRISPR-associated protein Cas5 [Chloroflexota bacterium]